MPKPIQRFWIRIRICPPKPKDQDLPKKSRDSTHCFSGYRHAIILIYDASVLIQLTNNQITMGFSWFFDKLPYQANKIWTLLFIVKSLKHHQQNQNGRCFWDLDLGPTDQMGHLFGYDFMHTFPDCFWFVENFKIYTPVTGLSSLKIGIFHRSGSCASKVITYFE